MKNALPVKAGTDQRQVAGREAVTCPYQPMLKKSRNCGMSSTGAGQQHGGQDDGEEQVLAPELEPREGKRDQRVREDRADDVERRQQQAVEREATRTARSVASAHR